MPHIFCPNTAKKQPTDYTEKEPSTVRAAKAKPVCTAAGRHSEVREVSCGMRAEIDQMLSSGVRKQDILCPVTVWRGENNTLERSGCGCPVFPKTGKQVADTVNTFLLGDHVSL